MATSLPLCDICMTDDATPSAFVWCSECEESICNDCEKQHSRMKLTKNHMTILIEDYQKLPLSVANIKQECKVHSRKLDFYCSIHNEPCCVSCVSQKHDSCKTWKPLSEVVNGVKSSAAFEDLEDRAKDISKLIDNLIKAKQDNKATFEGQKNRIISEMQKVRMTINDHLDKLQTDLLTKLVNEEKTQYKSIDSFIEKISKMHKNVDQIVNDLKQIKLYASDFQAFLGIHEWNKIIEAEEKDLMSFKTDQMMDTIDIHIEFSPILLKFEKDVKELGNLEVKFSSSKMILLQKEKQGQILVPVSHTVDTIELTQIRSFQTPDGVSSQTLITGIDMFDDGRIVLADNNVSKNRLVIMNQEGQFLKNIKLQDKCFGVAVIEKDTVATTLIHQRKIDIVDVNLSKVQQSISTSYECYGIKYTGYQLVVSLEKHIIQFLDLSGNTLSTLSTSDVSSNCSLLNDNLYYTTSKVGKIYSSKLNGEFRWKFDCQQSDYPSGITSDASRNIFVACRNSHQVIVLGQEGKTSRTILTNKNGLQKPRAIHYNRKNNFLLVCNLSGQCFVYKVT